MVGERELEQVVTVREIWAFLPKKCGGEVSLCCLGIRRSRFPHGNLCVVREIPSFYTTANYLRCSSKPHDFQGKSQAGLTGPASAPEWSRPAATASDEMEFLGRFSSLKKTLPLQKRQKQPLENSRDCSMLFVLQHQGGGSSFVSM